MPVPALDTCGQPVRGLPLPSAFHYQMSWLPVFSEPRWERVPCSSDQDAPGSPAGLMHKAGLEPLKTCQPDRGLEPAEVLQAPLSFSAPSLDLGQAASAIGPQCRWGQDGMDGQNGD